MTFADLQIHPSVLQAVVDVGYESPSAIQAATIPALMAGSDVVGLAQTGTGKTAAFAMPILSKIDTSSKATQALVLAPTRELALQVAEAFSRYGAHLPQINVLPIYGGSSYARATGRAETWCAGGGRHPRPGHRPPRTRDIGSVPRCEYLVLDEADEMLNMGFAEDVETDPVRDSGIQTGRVVLRDDAAGDPQTHGQVSARPDRSQGRGENRYRRQYFAALHPGRRSAQDGRADPRAGGRAVRGDDRLRPDQAGHRRGGRKAARPRVFRGGHQRRYPAEPA